LSNLTTQQLDAMAGGQPVRQVWTVRGVSYIWPPNIVYQDTVIDDGVMAGPGSMRRIVRAGSRKLEVWNPHPQDNSRPSAVRYAIEVDNSDGFFHMKVGSVWSPSTQNIPPSICFLLHNIYVWIPDPISPAWSPITHMDYIGKVIDVSYSGGGTQASTGGSSGVRPRTATIITEQVGAEASLRRTFKIADADIGLVTDATSGNVEYTF